jgi:hypothetical protein
VAIDGPMLMPAMSALAYSTRPAATRAPVRAAAPARAAAASPATPLFLKPVGAEVEAAPQPDVAEDAGLPLFLESGAGVIQKKCAACATDDEIGVGTIQRKCSACSADEIEIGTIQRKCSTCDEELIQPKEDGGPPGQPTNDVARSISALRSGGGGSIPATDRGMVEAGFGHDFSGVRVHTGTEASRLSRALDARAFTVGSDIVFGDGEYRPGTRAGRFLLAHELAHVLQQRNAGETSVDQSARVLSSADHEREADRVAAVVARGGTVHGWQPRAAGVSAQRYDVGDFFGDVIDVGGDVFEGGLDLAGDAIEGTADVVGTVAEAGFDFGGDVLGGAVGGVGDLTGIGWLSDAGDAIDEGLDSVGAGAHDLASGAGGLANDALDWTGQTGNAVLDEVADFARNGITFTLPDIPLCPRLSHTFKLGKYDASIPIVAGALPIGSVLLTGSIDLFLKAAPSLQLALGPCSLTEIEVTVNPFDESSVKARLTVAGGAALSVMVTGGVEAGIGVSILVPIAGFPVPIEIADASLQLGGFGFGQASVIDEVSIVPKVSAGLFGGLDIEVEEASLSLGGALDLWAGVFGKLEALDELLCSIIWPLVDYHLDGALRVDVDLSGMWDDGLGLPEIDVTEIDFGDIATALKRTPPKSKCPITDALCEWLRKKNLLPSQNGGVWNDGGPYGPGRRLAGPLDVYERDPAIPSGAHCRGACGPSCDTCVSHPTHTYVDPDTGETWTYTNFQDCNTHDGCKQHDAAFDWAADVKGERGGGIVDMIKPWHMAANIECTCTNDPANCIGWIMGMPPYSGKMYFADSAGEGGDGGREACREENPGAIDCSEDTSDMDAVLEHWGALYGFDDFDGFYADEEFDAGDNVACDTASGTLWRGMGSDTLTHERVPIGIYECACCEESSALGSRWQNVHVIRFGNIAEEILLRLCDAGALPEAFCEEVYRRVRERYGDEYRNPDLDPDEDVYRDAERPDDAPIDDDFRRLYNRLDSWNIYVRERHPDWYEEFDNRFRVVARRTEWLTELKERTKAYKESFRDISNTDVAELQRRFRENILGEMGGRIDRLNHEIAEWYRDRTGSSEDVETIIERIHAEGTEMWRRQWLAAVLAVNRVLSRLWPPARRRLEAFAALQRRLHPDIDLSGSIGELSYIGSLAKGYKGPPKQYVRFNPDSFDVDANLDAPPLAKYAKAIDGAIPDRERIFGRQTSIYPLNQFSDQAHLELSQEVRGYNTSDEFDVVIKADPTDEQRRHTEATERIYGLRTTLDPSRYRAMLDELDAEGLLAAGGSAVRPDLSETELERLNEILDRYDPGATP